MRLVALAHMGTSGEISAWNCSVSKGVVGRWDVTLDNPATSELNIVPIVSGESTTAAANAIVCNTLVQSATAIVVWRRLTGSNPTFNDGDCYLAVFDAGLPG